MPIHKFTREQFEAALPVNKVTGVPLWESVGLVQSEYEYSVPVYMVGDLPTQRPRFSIIIRSSVGSSGEADSTGKDSIRLWIQDHAENRGSKRKGYITRTRGWDRRLRDELRILYWIAKIAASRKCPNPRCTQGILSLRFSKDGRFPFLIHSKPCGHFEWIPAMTAPIHPRTAASCGN